VYDRYGDEALRISRCIGNKSLEYWWKYNEMKACRLAILTDDYEMARYNTICYDGKEQYTKEYETEHKKMEILEAWIKQIKSGKL
jgi:hypothetical protein